MPTATAANYDHLLSFAKEFFGEDRFVHRGCVPLFAEHTVKDKSGKVIRKFGKADLEQIVNACNSRISDTDDFGVLSDGHTPSDKADKHDPKVLGFIGPFKLGKIGRDNPRYAVMGHEWAYKDEADTIQRKPRRSVELDPETMTLDPVAALGSRPPVLDLGLKLESGRERYRYSTATFAGGSNVELPEHVKNESDCDRNQYEEPSMDPELEKLMAALESTDVFQWVKKKMAEEAAPGADGDVAYGEGEENEPPGDVVTPAEEEKEEALKMGKSETLRFEKLAAENKDLAQKYSKATAELDAIKGQVDGLIREREDARRDATLVELHGEKCINLENERKRCLYSKGSQMGGAAFDAHVQVIRELAADNPVGQTLPRGEFPPSNGHARFDQERNWATEAITRCQRYEREGKAYRYEEVYADVKAGK